MRSAMAIASRSASISRRLVGIAMLALLPAAHGPATASPLGAIEGHLGLGYGQLVSIGDPAANPLAVNEKQKAPGGGSLGVGAGVDFPVRGSLRAGVDIGFDLLGSTVVESGSQSADVDFS